MVWYIMSELARDDSVKVGGREIFICMQKAEFRVGLFLCDCATW